MANTILKLDRFKQTKQRQYLKRYRDRLDAFIKNRIPHDWGEHLMYLVEQYQINCRDNHEVVWDYADLRELVLQIVTDEIARDLYKELEGQFWFDPRWITLDALAERCYSYMVIGDKQLAAASGNS